MSTHLSPARLAVGNLFLRSLIALLLLVAAGAAHADVFVVTNTNSNGPGSLRQAILDTNVSNDPHSIVFDAAVFAAPRKSILLNSSLPVIGGTVTITAPEAGVVIDGNGNTQGPVFRVAGGANIIFTRLTISGGTSALGGGAISNFGTLLVDRCTITGNAGHEGGGISSDTTNSGGVLTVRNSTISNNSAEVVGGGLWLIGQSVIESSTITFNGAPTGRGGGIASGADSGTNTQIRNSIVSGNLFTDVDATPLTNGDGANSFASGGHNLIGDGDATAAFNAGGDQINVLNPRLDPLRDNGGPTRTRVPGTNSPALDAGRAFGLTTDQRGDPFVRTYDDPLVSNANGSDGTDIGAAERQPLPQGATTTFLEASPNPSAVGELVIFEATINPADDGFPTGTVTFKVDGAVVATRTLSGNTRTAFYETTFSSAGNRTVTAEFAGTGAFGDSDAIVEQVVETASITSLVVDTASDADVGACSGTPGDCTLRGAINRANASAGRQTITFNIPGAGVHTIAPTSPMPLITGTVTIDGFSQPGSVPGTDASGAINATPLIELDGSGIGPGSVALPFAAGTSGSVVRGLVIHSFSFGIVMDSSRNTIAGNFIGTNAAGTERRLNSGNGIRLNNSSENIIGGTAAADRNLISGNEVHAIEITGQAASGNTVVGNLIGSDKSATNALSTTIASDGVFVFNAPNNVIANNFIVGHGNAQTTSAGQGVVIAGSSAGFSGAQNNVVRGNTLGTLALPNATDGIVVFNASGTRIGGTTAPDRNLIAGNGDDGVQVVGSSDTVVHGNFIGTRDGTTAEGNFDEGIVIEGRSTGTVIGGNSQGARNVIVANGDAGVFINGDETENNRVTGNYIGLNALGSGVLGNVGNGVIIVDSPGNFVGGSTNERNVIAGNQSAGIAITGAGATANRVRNNYLGTNASGHALSARSPDAGVIVADARNNEIGSAAPSEGNLIANHANAGVIVSGPEASGNAIRNNMIGANANNGGAPNNGGISIRDGAHDNLIGGSATSGNVINFNTGAGVEVLGDASDQNRISFNSMRANTGLGIDLGGNGRDPNDPGDADTGPNQGQNTPVIQSVTASQVVVQLSSTPNTTFRVEVFVSESQDPNNDVEGQSFLGALEVSTDATGMGQNTLSPTNGVPGSRFVTATAIDPVGNTSEFSLAELAPSGPQPTEVNSMADDGPGSLRQAILHANNTNGHQTITFNFPQARSISGVPETFKITPLSPLPPITGPLTINGFSQPGSQANTLETGSDAIVLIEFDGAGANMDGFTVDSGEFVTLGTVIRGLKISNFGGAGLRLRSALNVVAGCIITGNGEGVFIDGGRDNSIGKASTYVGNLIEPSGNTTGDRNLISGNLGAGIRIAARPGFTAGGNNIHGSYIGTDAQGTSAQPNGVGIVVSTPRNRIGFRFLREGNLISGNNGDGIALLGDVGTSSGFNNVISGNLIGTAVNGTDPLGNNGDGIQIGTAEGESSRNFVGGSGAGADNRIANNAGHGIRVVNGTRNTLSRNRTTANGRLGIDLVGGAGEDRFGVTPNDAGDADTGPNELQNFPEITSVTSGGGTTSIEGTFQSAPGNYTLEFFRNSGPDPSGTNEGAIFYTSENVTVPPSGTLPFEVTRSTPLPAGSIITATATDSLGNTSELFNLISDEPGIPSHLLNLSTRGNVQNGDNVLISGVIITGTEPKKVMFRAVGNSMSINGVPVAGRLSDPTLTLHAADGSEIGFNDNWNEAPEPERTEIANSPLRPEDAQEAAILRMLEPGQYTAVVRGQGDTMGLALIEAYDVGEASDGRFANLSTRGLVGTGDNILIGGAIVGGGGGAEIVVRAIGPSMQTGGAPVPGRMSDPTLQLIDSNGMIVAENDNWQSDPAQAQAITASGLAPEDPAEAAILITLPPGGTTALVRGSNDTTGIALVEIYQLRNVGGN